MKKGYVIGTLLGLTAGVGVTLGVHEYLAMKSELKAVQSKSPTATQSTSTPLQDQPIQPLSTALPSQTAQPKFDSLSPCDQLDAIAKAGKSVTDFLVAFASGNTLSKYETAIGSSCPWNAEQLAVANQILNPPVVTTAPTTQRPSAVVDEPISSGSVVATKPLPRWNNCNGIQEPGESYDPACADAQEFNDKTWGARDNRDRRTSNVGGIGNRGDGVTKPYHQGYSAN